MISNGQLGNPWNSQTALSKYPPRSRQYQSNMTDSAHMQVSKEMDPGKKNAFLVNPRITSAIQIGVNGSQAVALLDPCTKNGNLISNRFCQLYNIPTTEMQRKPLETAVQGSKSMMTHKADLDLDIQGYKVKIPFYAANLKSWDVILGEPALTELDAIMDIKHNATSIKPKHQPRMELLMMKRSGDR